MAANLGERIQRYFKVGSTIFREGEYGSSMYIITSGEVEVSTVKNNQKVILARLQKGAVFGEMALIDQPYRSATITALSDVSCIEINKVFFNTSMQQLPNWIRSFYQILVERLRAANKKQDSYTFSDKAKQIVLTLDMLLELNRLKNEETQGVLWQEVIGTLEIILNIPANFIEKVFNRLIVANLIERVVEFKVGRLIKIADPEKFQKFVQYCREALMAKMNKEYSSSFRPLTGEQKRWIEFISDLIKEQAGGTDFNMQYLDARCNEMLGRSLATFDSTLKYLQQRRVLQIEVDTNGDKSYVVDKAILRRLLLNEQTYSQFLEIDRQLGKE